MQIHYLTVPLAAYLVGGIPFGLILGKLKGIDIREHGSGNIGATNVWRTCGKGFGLTCFVFDSMKGFLPVFAAGYFSGQLSVNADYAQILAAGFTVLGHTCSPYLKFRGGKGVATSAGAVFALSPAALGTALAAWIVTLALFKLVGLASVVAAIVLPLSAFLYQGLSLVETGVPVLCLLSVLGALTVFRHKSNIQRIIAGTEPKIGSKKESDESSSPQ